MKIKKIVLCLILIYMNTSSYSEPTIVEPESYCEIVKKIAYNAQSYRQNGAKYEVTIKKLQAAPEKLSASKRENNELVFRIVQYAYYIFPEYTNDELKNNAIEKYAIRSYSECLKKYG
ncbi:hypothetical protein F895_03697 [Acinetobacter sp. CIP 64.2]|uniref:hypothetical protein n=1 Tax=Acinetobacter sp. CIP 64.2 TaxID=1217694 RepID=UPI00028899F4|nr:hypothetical protein [Acinetobacter sp. CIP 64.2]EHU2434349.1 hypothetical protein [Acinetobacter baumannii]EIB6924447.1 hypothetical protein [Acinetobacter baumannii]ENX11722.1 hypothetical protein F895_03697 [Acinetobacter sp. CIP 64.2]